ncbi:MAG: calcium-binding protein [Sulfitobacter sp.]
MPVNIGNQVAPYTITTIDTYFLAQTDLVITPAGGGTVNNGILNEDQVGAEMIVAGTVIAGNVGLRANADGDETRMLITATGVVVGQRWGIAVDVGNVDTIITNHGNISGYEQSGIGILSDNTAIINTGSVNGIINGVYFLSNSSSGTLTNSGTISGGNGVSVEAAGTVITNSGSIFADGSTGASGYGITTDGNDLNVTNTGTIAGEGAAILGGTGIDFISNSGTLAGNVILGGEDDTYIGSGDGVVTGILSLGAGDDYAQLGNAGGHVQANSGDDTIRGGTGSDEIEGGNENDDIRGRAGADILNGGDGNDIIRAGRGDDIADGGAGNDFMRGGAGEDILIGGLGQDTMYGNAGADVFQFNTASESTNAGAAWDRIMDFTQGQDLIDLSAFNARFIGTGAYAANGNIAEVRIFEDPNGDTRVFVDVNADGTSDMRFYLVNTLGVTADDFIL